MGKGGQTIGFHYLFDILFGLGRGPINELRAIKVADKIAWEGPLCGDGPQAIKKPDLFGGEKKEGGIQGPFRVFFGSEEQVLPGAGSANCGPFGPLRGNRPLPDVKQAIGGLVSEMRGTTMLWFSGLISSMNPYPKEWTFRVRRYSAGWWQNDCFYPAKSVIFMADGQIHAMNPAHIIYQCLTDPLWGRGLPKAYLNENSFIYAANTFCTEGFGLCFAWQRGEEIDQFIMRVLEHCGAVLYADPETGKMTIRLIRADYNIDDLPLFTPSSGLLDITEDDSNSQDESPNEMIGTGRDPITNEDFQVRVHNLALRQSQGSPNSADKDYSGIPTRELMARVLQRDLKVFSSGLKKLNVVLDRSGWKIRPGMVFRISDPRRGIVNMVLRAGEITDQSFKDGRVTLKTMEDVFGLPATSYVTPTETTWTPPADLAVPATEGRLIEAGYRDILRQKGLAAAQALDATDSFVGALALSPNPVMYQYELVTRAAGEPAFAESTSGSFTGAATLVDAINPLQITFEITGETDFADASDGEAILVGDEQMQLVAYDAATHIVTVKRGVADTLPSAHAAAATLWTLDDDLVGDERAYVSGELVEAKVLTRTSSDLLDEDLAAPMTITLEGRQGRPYPPAGATVNEVSVYALSGTYAVPEIEWAHRDRILQADQLVGHNEASVGPEAGTTYNLRVYDASAPGVVLRSVPGIVGTTWTYDSTMQAADGAPSAVWVELESARDGLTSLQSYRFYVQLNGGYGMGYGYNYGGM
jgi:hypothetical protein